MGHVQLFRTPSGRKPGDQGIDALNKSIEILQPCGTYTAEQVNEAYAAAINARIIFEVNLDQLDVLEENIPGAAK